MTGISKVFQELSPMTFTLLEERVARLEELHAKDLELIQLKQDYSYVMTQLGQKMLQEFDETKEGHWVTKENGITYQCVHPCANWVRCDGATCEFIFRNLLISNETKDCPEGNPTGQDLFESKKA